MEIVVLMISNVQVTWNNKQQGYNRVLSKLDRALVNMGWQKIYLTTEVSLFHA